MAVKRFKITKAVRADRRAQAESKLIEYNKLSLSSSSSYDGGSFGGGGFSGGGFGGGDSGGGGSSGDF